MLWKDVVISWEPKEREIALKEVIGNQANEVLSPNSLDAFYVRLSNLHDSDAHKEIAEKVFLCAYGTLLEERSKNVCKVGKLI